MEFGSIERVSLPKLLVASYEVVSDGPEQTGLGCASPEDCYSLFSNEDTPCLEEIYWDNGVQHMSVYLPVR